MKLFGLKIEYAYVCSCVCVLGLVLSYAICGV